MSTTVKQLRAFVAVARTRSLAEASAQLHVSQPAISIAIRSLEESLGGALFSRDGRQLVLTPEGTTFVERAQQLLHNWDNTLDAVQQRFRLQQGQLSIAAIPAFALNQLPELLREFHRRHPDINIVLEDIVMERVVHAVQQGRAELGISFRPDDLGNLSFTPIGDDRFIAVLPTDHRLQRRKTLRWQDLAREPFIAMNRGSAVRRWTDEAFSQSKEEGAQPRLLCEANQLSTIGRLVQTGLGVSAVPSLCEAQMQSYGLICKPLTEPALTHQVGVLVRESGALSAPAQAFLSVALGSPQAQD
ncbi:LysR family transcriptional regulator [Microbulbifer pacificus]|uniref:LysR substrate-binding domain-containing protein n=1 Tax=Microbulbifer pacificus TaxID=407164 RepID=A0AAU0MX91_9GAMM|nr:LysR substrate-binding domain-containing protein [Microbulbifer pacificus]WOX05230.1 LysR substrate-binding domain-containing protein [Microbulbifer pacificus]